MKLSFRKSYKSIDRFEPVELANFSILTGINGSGKTQLLHALRDGNCTIDDISNDEVVFFDFFQFKIENDDPANSQQIRQERADVWYFFKNSAIQKNKTLKRTFEHIKKNNLNDEECEKIETISLKKDIPVLQLKSVHIEDEELRIKFTAYRKEIMEVFVNEEIKVYNLPSNLPPNLPPNLIQNIETLSKKANTFMHKISEKDFLELYVPTNLKQNLLPTKLGQIFLNYRIKEFEEIHKIFDESSNLTKKEVELKAAQKCQKMFGGNAPWELLNDLLTTFTTLPYSISFPEKLTMDDYSSKTEQPFIPKLKCFTNKEILIDYEDLSSGEQVMFALALCMFKTKSDKFFPKLLLLDEIDATLHPSMIENLLRVIQEIFLKNNSRVILATHSPTVIALSPEKSIFVVNQNSANTIEKRNKEEALNILTQGYVTMEQGLKLVDQISKKEMFILTEGCNTKYIQKALEILAPDLTEQTDVITGAEGSTGANQLKTLFKFFMKIQHDKKVLFIWDCDVDISSETNTNKTYSYKFQKNSLNTLTSKGIENNFDEDLFENFKKTTISRNPDDDSKYENTEFDKKLKNKFLDHVMYNATPEIFKNFKPLIEHIQNILLDKK